MNGEVDDYCEVDRVLSFDDLARMVDANDIGGQDLIEVESPRRDPVFVIARYPGADVAGQSVVETVISQNPAGTGNIESNLIVDGHLSAVYSSNPDRAI
jgi:hypothetical protein